MVRTMMESIISSGGHEISFDAPEGYISYSLEELYINMLSKHRTGGILSQVGYTVSICFDNHHYLNDLNHHGMILYLTFTIVDNKIHYDGGKWVAKK